MKSNIIERWQSLKNNSSHTKRLFNNLNHTNPKKNHKAAEKIHEEVFEEIDCLNCANCCKSIPPIVSKRDSKRISKYLNLKPSEFEQAYLVTDEDGDQVINKTPCPFLEKDNKCKIYSVRPNACRQYPHSGDFNFFNHLSMHKRNSKYCPALFEIITRLTSIKDA